MLNLRLDEELAEYIESRTENKSEYVRNLIREDKIRNHYGNDKLEEYTRCKNDILHFVNYFCYIDHPKENKKRVNLFDHQKRILKLLADGKSVLILKGRGLGITTVLSAYSLWKTVFYSDIKIGFSGMRPPMTHYFINDFFDYMDLNLPDWIRKPRFYDSSELKYFQNGSKIESYQTNEDYQCVIFDEASYNVQLGSHLDSVSGGNTQLILTANGVLKESDNYEILKSLFEDPTVENIDVSWRDHPNRDLDWKRNQVKRLGGESKFKKEHESIVETYW